MEETKASPATSILQPAASSDSTILDPDVAAAAPAPVAAVTGAAAAPPPQTPTDVAPDLVQQLSNVHLSGTQVDNTAAFGRAAGAGPPETPIQPEPTGGAPNSGQRIWRGSLHVREHRNDMVVPCVAMRYPTPTRPPVHDAQGWPAQIHCDSSKLKHFANVFKYINEPASQWHVRFAPIDEEGKEISNPRLVQLVKVMVQRQLSFEIDCGEGTMRHGTLFLWGMPMPPHGLSLLGVFRPKPAE